MSNKDSGKIRKAGGPGPASGNLQDSYGSDNIVELLDQYSHELITSLPEPFLIYDREMKVVYANSLAVEAMAFDPTGMSREEIGKKLDLQVVSGSGTEQDRPVPEYVLQGEIVRNVYYRFRNPAGELHIALGSFSPLSYQGEVIGVVSTWHDITEQVQREQFCIYAKEEVEDKLRERTAELVQSEKVLRKIFSNRHMGIAVMDREFNYIRINGTFARAVDMPPPFITGRNHFELFPDEDIEWIFGKVLREGHSYFAMGKIQLFENKQAGSKSCFDWSIHPVVGESGEISTLMLMLVDTSRRMRAEEGLRDARMRLEHSGRLSDIGSLAATVAHELRNPLGVIRTATFNLRRKNDNQALVRHIDNIDKKIEESVEIINNLLYYSRMQAPDLKRVRLSSVINDSISSVRNRFRKRRVKISRDLAQMRGRSLRADPAQLGEVFTNILNNAVQAIEGRGRIYVSASVDNGRVEIDIADNGKGIDKDDLEKVFDPFFTRRARGTGLGLAICRELVELNGGSIWIESEQGRGTTVSVQLPLEGKKYE